MSVTMCVKRRVELNVVEMVVMCKAQSGVVWVTLLTTPPGKRYHVFTAVDSLHLGELTRHQKIRFNVS